MSFLLLRNIYTVNVIIFMITASETCRTPCRHTGGAGIAAQLCINWQRTLINAVCKGCYCFCTKSYKQRLRPGKAKPAAGKRKEQTGS